MTEQEIYQRFMDWLKQTWWGLPEADELVPLIMAQYTPEEASLLTGMPFSGTNREELAEMKQLDPAELGKRLDELAGKGLVFRTVKGDTIRYSLNDHFFIGRTGGWPGRTDERSKTIAPLMNQYYYHGMWDQYNYTHTKGLRALPIQGTIEDTREVLPYEEVVKVLDQHDYFTVTTCPCKHRKNLDPEFPDCKYPTEVCLHFGRLGHYIVENGLGREITRQETEEILRQSAEAGLVHGVSNMQEGPDTICNCDPCCCVQFEAFHKLKHAEGMTPSNYRVRTNDETCIGCGLCVKRCPMDALHLEDFPEAKGRITVVAADNKELKNKSGKVSVVDPDLCIGCGVCAYKCPSKSLMLERRETIEHPPKDILEHTRLVMADFAAGRAQRGQGKT
ncbi:MAG: 4Fe-4S binding protein [Dehalococcoidia bacterium]|nr:4Fe-4S binding protein [Dehalococcoidia bacterium]